MNKLVYWGLSFYFVMSVACFAESFISKESPNREYLFRISNSSSVNRMELINKNGKVLWKQPIAGTIDHPVFSWASNSSGVVYIQDDRSSIFYLKISEAGITNIKVDEKPLIQAGENAIPYDESIPNQGTIPHDMIISLVSTTTPTTFYGIYERSKFPKKISIRFQMTLVYNSNECSASFVIVSSKLVPW